MKFSYRDFKLSVNDVEDFLASNEMRWNHEISLILGSKDISYRDFNDNSFSVKISNRGSLNLLNKCAIINPISFIILDWKKFDVHPISLKEFILNSKEYNKYVIEDLSVSWIKYLSKKYKDKYKNLIVNSMKVEVYDAKNEFKESQDKYNMLASRYENVIDTIANIKR